jgi:BirA family biotin operon repressor/biotin-[acetyl-CoA-carboxylase] ligase
LKALDREVRKLTEVSRLADQKSAQRDILIRFEAISSWVRGKRVYVAEDSGYTGVTAGLDEHGFLLVGTSRGLRRVLSGGVRSAGDNERE